VGEGGGDGQVALTINNAMPPGDEGGDHEAVST
jgi:hypothetical protein